MVYTVTFAPCIDYRLSLGDKPIRIGGVNRPFARENRLGGKGITVGSMLVNLGVDNFPIVAVGGNAGDGIRDMVQRIYSQSGFHSGALFLETETESRINVVVLADTDTRFDPAAPKVRDEEIERMYAYLRNHLQKGDILVLSGSIGQEKTSIYADIMREVANPCGATTIVDSTGDALTATFPYHPFFIKPNDEELGDLLDTEIEGEDDIVAGGKKLLSLGPQNVIVSMGGKGSFFFAGDGSIYRIGVAIGYPFINPVGTGDSSIAGFIKGYVERRPIEECLKLMAAAGGATAFSHGLGSLALTEELAQQIQIEKIA